MAGTTERILLLSTLLIAVIVVLSLKNLANNEIIIEEITSNESIIVETTSNIIFRYGTAGGKHPNELDTFEGIFIKDMVNKEPIQRTLDLTQEEMDTVYRKMVDIGFFSYPKSFQPTVEGDIVGRRTPFGVYYLKYYNETGAKLVYWTTATVAPDDVHYQNLKELAQLIIGIIQAKPEYQEMPEPSAGYA